MGLISFIFDCLVISSACAGARRVTGFNVGQKVVDMVKNEKALTFTKGFFNVGEWVVDKGINYTRRKIIQNNLNEFKDYTMKPNSTNLSTHQNGNTYQHQHHQQNQYIPHNNQQQQQQQQQQNPPPPQQNQSQQNNNNQQYRF